jgi:hypothetical protein
LENPTKLRSSLALLTLALAAQAHAQSTQAQTPGYSDQRGFGTESSYSPPSIADQNAIAKDGAEAARASKINRGFGTEGAYSSKQARTDAEVAAEGAKEARASKINRGFGTDAAHWDTVAAPGNLAQSPSVAHTAQ